MKKSITICLLIFAVLAGTFVLYSCNKEEIVMKVGSHNISIEEYRYFYMNYRNDYISSGEKNYAEKIKSDVEGAMKKRYAIVDYAQQIGVGLTEDDKSNVETMVEEQKKTYGSSFDSAMKDQFLTEKLYRQILQENFLEAEIRNYESNEATSSFLSDDKTVEKYVTENFYRIKQIVIPKGTDKNGLDAQSKIKAITDSVIITAASEANFDAMIKKYSTDFNMDIDGYCLRFGSSNTILEDEIRKLSFGCVSGAILIDNNYHIVMRLPIDKTYLNAHFEELRNKYVSMMIDDILKNKADEIKIEYTKDFEKWNEENIVNYSTETKKEK